MRQPKFKIVELPEEVGPGGDVRDYFQKYGHEGEDLAMLIDRTSFLKPEEITGFGANGKDERRLDAPEPESWLELLGRRIKESPEMVGRGLVPEKSIAVLGGPPKIGKSMLTTNLALSVASGRLFLGIFPTRRARVLMIEAEVGPLGLQKRLRKMKEGAPFEWEGADFLVLTKGAFGRMLPKIDEKEGFDMLRAAIEPCAPDLVIIDPLSRFHHAEENEANQMQMVMERFDALVMEFGCSIVLVHHHRKPGRDEGDLGAQALRGSSAIFGFGDSYLSLTKGKAKGEGKRATLSFELRQAEDPEPMKLVLNPETLWWESLEQATGGQSLKDRQVVGALTELGDSAWRSDLIEALEKSGKMRGRTAADAIVQAWEKELIHREMRDGKHWYALSSSAQGVVG